MSTNQLQVFTNSEFGTLNVLIEDGREYFPATECARILGYTNPEKAIRDHCRGGTKRSLGVQTGIKADGSPAMQTVMVNYIPEGDLYRLISRSKLPAAVRFETWLFDEVLPSIRRNGGYAPNIAEIVAQTAQAVISELLPFINRTTGSEPVRKRKRYKKTLFKVEMLEAGIRDEIDDMLLSRRYSYLDICTHCERKHRVSFSKSALQRYAQQVYINAAE